VKCPHCGRFNLFTTPMSMCLCGRVILSGFDHKLPMGRSHIASQDCWCRPETNYVDPVTGITVWVHKSMEPIAPDELGKII